MDKARLRQLGDELYQALRSCSVLDPLTERHPQISIEDAYHVSLRMLERRLADGERIVGKKIGVTSRAVQEMLGVYQPDFGFLTDAMHYENGASISIAGQLIQPRAEAEIAFVLRERLKGPGVTEQDVQQAAEYIAPCFEIVDSRIRDWRIRIQDTIADNASCGVFVLGEGRAAPGDFSLPQLRIEVYKNGAPLSSGLGEAVQGNPLSAVAWVANAMGRYGVSFEPGDIILSGSLVPLEPVTSGDKMHLELKGVGSAHLSFC